MARLLRMLRSRRDRPTRIQPQSRADARLAQIEREIRAERLARLNAKSKETVQ
jgi:hypothetical protein